MRCRRVQWVPPGQAYVVCDECQSGDFGTDAPERGGGEGAEPSGAVPRVGVTDRGAPPKAGVTSAARPAPSVLVVDDQDDARSLVIGLLQRDEAGWVIAGEAASGEEALGQARRTRPDVVVLDYRMGGIDGLETARRLLDEDPGLVIVLVSGDADRAMEARCAAVGIQAFLAKTELWRLAEVMRPFATGGRGSTGRPRGSDDGAGGDGRRGG